jgi:DNA polymerase
MTADSLPFADYQMPTAKNPHGLFVLVGEAPGAQEIKQGRPFVGRSGQLLDKNLKELGILREECMIVNVFRHQPPGNKVGHFFLSKRAAQNANEEIAEEWGKFAGKFPRKLFAKDLDHLKKTLREKKPKVIVTLGSTPLWALTGKEGITTIRGQKQECRFMDVPVIPTLHPSYIIRGNWNVEPLFKSDLEQAQGILKAKS